MFSPAGSVWMVFIQKVTLALLIFLSAASLTSSFIFIIPISYFVLIYVVFF